MPQALFPNLMPEKMSYNFIKTNSWKNHAEKMILRICRIIKVCPFSGSVHVKAVKNISVLNNTALLQRTLTASPENS
jgi:hypothetical protein